MTPAYRGTRMNRSMAIFALLSVRLRSRRNTTLNSSKASMAGACGIAKSSVSATGVTGSLLVSGIEATSALPRLCALELGSSLFNRTSSTVTVPGYWSALPDLQLNAAAAAQVHGLLQLVVSFHLHGPVVGGAEGEGRRIAALEEGILRRPREWPPEHPVLARERDAHRPHIRGCGPALPPGRQRRDERRYRFQ